MKKFIAIAIIAALIGASMIFLMRNRFGMNFFPGSRNESNDLIIFNDSSDSMSVEYKDKGKDVAPVVKPSEKISGGQGFIKIFIAKENGVYELTYSFPRPAGSPLQISLSQIINSVKQEKLSDELITKQGMIGDIKVNYEEVRELDATY